MSFACGFGGTVRGRDYCPNGCTDGRCNDAQDAPEVEEVEDNSQDNVESEELP